MKYVWNLRLNCAKGNDGSKKGSYKVNELIFRIKHLSISSNNFGNREMLLSIFSTVCKGYRSKNVFNIVLLKSHVA